MSLTSPKQTTSKPFSEVFQEGDKFILDGARVVEVRNTRHGSGEMVLLTIRDQPEELSVWGTYLLAQVKDAERSDFGKEYRIVRKRVPGFADERDVKALEPVTDF